MSQRVLSDFRKKKCSKFYGSKKRKGSFYVEVAICDLKEVQEMIDLAENVWMFEIHENI